MPNASSRSPVTSSRRTPTALTSLAPVTADARNAVTDVASHDTPVFVGEYPSTCCMSSEPRKMNEKKAPNVKNAGEVGSDERPVAERGGGNERRLRPTLDADEDRQQQPGEAEQQQRRAGRPAVVGATIEGVHEEQQAACDRRRAGGVELARLMLGVVGGEDHRGERDQQRADRHVDEEHPAPAGSVGQEAAGDHPYRRRRPTHRAEDAERPVALSPFGERHGEDRQRGRCDQGGAEALQSAGDDQ